MKHSLSNRIFAAHTLSERILLVLCLIVGPVGMAYLDWKYSFLGLLTLILFLGALYLTWPALMPAFLAGGFMLSAYHARLWVKENAGRYRCLFQSGFRSIFDSSPFFLILGFDLACLVLLEGSLRQAWFNMQRGSAVAAIVVAFFSTPVLLLGARAIGKPLVRRALGNFRIEAEAAD